jgi:transposase-like protein
VGHFRRGECRRAGDRGNFGEFFEQLERRLTLEILSAEDLLAASGDIQGLKDVSSTVVQDALREPVAAEVAARLGAGRWERSEYRNGLRRGSRTRTVSTPAGVGR